MCWQSLKITKNIWFIFTRGVLCTFTLWGFFWGGGQGGRGRLSVYQKYVPWCTIAHVVNSTVLHTMSIVCIFIIGRPFAFLSVNGTLTSLALKLHQIQIINTKPPVMTSCCHNRCPVHWPLSVRSNIVLSTGHCQPTSHFQRFVLQS